MKPKWLLQTDIFKENIDGLIQAIEKFGYEYDVYKYVPFWGDKTYKYVFKPDDCIIFYGSLNFAQQIKKETCWTPGVYCDLNQLKCSSYYTYFGAYLLNQDYWMLPFGELKRRKEEIFRVFGDNFFIRPDSGFKTFTGQILGRDNFDKEISFFKNYGLEDNSIVLLSSLKNLAEEYRFVVCENKVVTGSLYKRYLENETSPQVPTDAVNFAQNILNSIDFPYQDPYTLDVAKVGDNFFVVEINSFSCSGFYQADVEKIVEAVSQKALKDWEEIYG